MTANGVPISIRRSTTSKTTVYQMGAVYHMGLDVRGALHNWSARLMRGVFSHDDGRVMTAYEARNFLMDEIARGHRVIPCDPAACDAWDFERGCPGHPVEAG